MPSDDPLRNEPLVSVEFEVFGKVQGKNCKLITKEIYSFVRVFLMKSIF